MIRIALITVAAMCLAGCGQAGSAGSNPLRPAHHPARSPRPPSATIVTAAGTHGLTLGSYCWSARTGTGGATVCGDAGDPALYPGLVVAHAAVGETIMVHLRFTPTDTVEATIGKVRYRLAPAADLRLRVRRAGILTLDPRHGSDDVQYVARIVTGPA
jgi:hypothetical protein